MTPIREQLRLGDEYKVETLPGFSDAGAAENKTLPLHRWVPWIAGFSARFVQDVVREYLPSDQRGECLVLDPFAGIGTTLVEGLRAGANVLGFEINAYAALAANTKLQCLDLSSEFAQAQLGPFVEMLRYAEEAIDQAWMTSREEGLAALPRAGITSKRVSYKSRIPFFSPPVEAKISLALDSVAGLAPAIQPLVKVALGATMVSVSNYTYEPSLSSRPGAGKPLIENISVVEALGRKLREMLEDISITQATMPPTAWRRRHDVVLGSYFDSCLPENSVSLVITSPPYMNNYHYVRNTRPQLYWLGLVSNQQQLRDYETGSFGKFWQTVRGGPVVSLTPKHTRLEESLKTLRGIRADKGVYGGQGWANYVATYFNDSWRLLKSLKHQMAHGATAIIVVGNSVIQGIEFKVDEILADLAEAVGLRAEQIVIVRTKRVGNSILGSSVRNDEGSTQKSKLYDAAVILRKES